jgi:hypothetical protein
MQGGGGNFGKNERRNSLKEMRALKEGEKPHATQRTTKTTSHEILRQNDQTGGAFNRIGLNRIYEKQVSISGVVY